jgi:hypothetical protein
VPNRPPAAMSDRPSSIDRPATRYTTELDAERTSWRGCGDWGVTLAGSTDRVWLVAF